MGENFYYHGIVNVYLQGKKALRVDQQNSGYLQCYLGSKNSRIRIRDFRPRPRLAATAIFHGGATVAFKDTFCQPATAKIVLKHGKVHIDLHDHVEENPTPHISAPTLWLGVVKDGESIPLRSVDWEVYRPVGKVRTGFAILSPR